MRETGFCLPGARCRGEGRGGCPAGQGSLRGECGNLPPHPRYKRGAWVSSHLSSAGQERLPRWGVEGGGCKAPAAPLCPSVPLPGGGGTGEVAHPGVAHPAPGAAPRRVPAGGLRLHLLMTCPPCLLPLCRRTRGRFFPPPPSLGKALRWERSPGRGSAGAAAAARGSARPPAALATGPCFKQASLVQKTLYFTPSFYGLRVGPCPVPPFFNSVFYTVTSFLYEIIPTLNY